MLMRQSDKILVKQACQGDTQAFGELYSMYAVELYKYACCVTGSTLLAQDAVQEAVMCAFAEISDLRNQEAFKGWLFKILSNVCLRQFSKKYEVYAVGDACDMPDTSIDDIEISTNLRIALEGLDTEERMVLLLSSVSGYKSREIASMLNCSASTVRSKLARTLKKLRLELED